MLDSELPLARRRKFLRIGSGFLPMLMGDGLHSYRVTKDPLPADTVILGATMEPGLRAVVLLLESPSFPETIEGSPYPEIEPQFTRV